MLMWSFEQPKALCFITYDDEHHRIGFAQLPGDPVENTPKNPGLAHLAFTYANVRALQLDRNPAQRFPQSDPPWLKDRV